MNYTEMTGEDLELRMAAIATECEAEDADTNALLEEARAIKAELETRRAAAEERAKELEAVAETPITEPVIEERENKMDNIEIRNSKQYIDAYAEYIKTGKAEECRALLTENVSGGQVPVPEFVYDIVKNAWEKEGIMSLVRKSYLRGNVKVSFEISGEAATTHTEGAAAINPENLVLGIVEMKPASIKKVVQISDEVYDLRGEEFLRYVYDEITYRIARAAADNLLTKIKACGTVSTNTPTTNVAVGVLEEASIALGTIAKALAKLSDQCENPVVVMNKLTWASFKAAQYAASFPADPFEGCPVVFNNTITAFSAATTGVPYAIVGDFGQGALANFPNGDAIDFKFDDLSLKKQDLIEILGREYVAVDVVAPDAFVQIMKEA